MDLLAVMRQKVDSSHIVAIGHDEETNTLIVEFEAAVWAYSPVTKSTFKSMLHADSIGKFFHANIKMDDSLSKERLQ